MNYLLKKDKVKNLLLSASREWQTYIPLEDFSQDVQFMKFEGEQDIGRLNLDYESLIVPPKVFAFPQLESLFEFKDGEIIETAKPKTNRLLFGLRACDVKGVLFLDGFFKKNFEDIYYLNRSRDKLMVIVGCKKPLESCFCTSTKTGPFLSEGFDLQLVDIGEHYFVEIGSNKGEDFVNSFDKFFEKVLEGDIQRSKTAKRKAEKSVSLKVDFEKAIKKFCEDKVPKDMYEQIAQRCIYCGGCLYVCPTCSCFNVFDESTKGLAKRYRNWDTCVFEGYTREASGHNPRQEKWLRTSRRYEHKLKYDYLVSGMSGCVGCGRCLLTCPVNIGISQVIEEVCKD